MTDPTHPLPIAPLAPLPRWLSWGLRAAALLATLGVFALYQRSDFLLTLADQVWSCF